MNGAPPARFGLGRYLGYAGGEVANNLTFAMVSSFLLIYYTDVAGIAASTAGTLFLIVRVWGGVTDLVAGGVVDKTSTRWGRFRPFLVTTSVPLLLLLVALFSIPGGLGSTGAVVWAFVTYALFQTAYSFVNIPYGSLGAAMTQDADVRSRLSTARSVAASLTILVIAGVISPQISGAGDLQRSLTITTIVFAVIGYALYVWCFSTARESVARDAAPVTIRDAGRMLRENRPLVLLCLSSLVFLSGMFAIQTVGVYYARDVLGNADLYIVMVVVQTVGMILASVSIPKAVEVLGKKRTYIVAGAIAAAGGVGVAIAPSSTPALGIACFGVLGIGIGVINTLIFAIQPDTVDYGEWKSDVRSEGSNYAALSFARKAGQGVGGAAAAYTIGFGGYVSGADDQTDGAIDTIRIAIGVIPAALFIGAAAIMVAYPLNRQKFHAVIAELDRRHAAAGAAPTDGSNDDH